MGICCCYAHHSILCLCLLALLILPTAVHGQTVCSGSCAESPLACCPTFSTKPPNTSTFENATAQAVAANCTCLDLHESSLTSIPSAAFSGLTLLQLLFLDKNQLTSVASATFSGLTRLTRLHLEFNQLTSITSGVFSELTQLQLLYLNNNQLTSIASGALSGLAQLTYLDIGVNQLTSLASGTFSGLTQFQTLCWADNPGYSSNSFSDPAHCRFARPVQWSTCHDGSANGSFVFTSSPGYICAFNSIPCSAGTYADHNSSTVCTACSAGTFNNATGASVCLRCPAGHFTAHANNTLCTACSVGTYSNITGASVCLSCPAGYASADRSTCDMCPAGRYTPHANSTACTSCSAGTYSNVTGVTVCSGRCPAGTFGNVTGATGADVGCGLCPVDTYSNITGASTCHKCLCYQYCPSGSSGPQPCEPGFLCRGFGPCPAGSYCIDNKQAACPEGTYCPEGSSHPIVCPPDHFCPAGATQPSQCTTRCAGDETIVRACTNTHDTQCHVPSDPLNLPWPLVGALLGVAAFIALLAYAVRRKYPASRPWDAVMAVAATFDVFADVQLIVHMHVMGWTNLFTVALCVFALALLSNVSMTLHVWTRALRTVEFQHWFDEHTAVAAVLCLISLSNINVMNALASGVFGLSMLSAPWPRERYNHVIALGLVDNILEDIPQIVLGILAAQKEGSWSSTTTLAVMSSIFMAALGLVKRCSVWYTMRVQRRAQSHPQSQSQQAQHLLLSSSPQDEQDSGKGYDRLADVRRE